MAKVIVFVICLGAAGSEIVEGAKEAGGISDYLAKLATEAGVGDLSGALNLGDLFESAVDVAEGSFNALKFIKSVLVAGGDKIVDILVRLAF